MSKVKRNLRPLIRFLRWSGTPSQGRLLQAIRAHLSEAFSTGRQNRHVDTALIPERQRRYLFEAGSAHLDRYEFLIYRQLRDRIESGDLFCAESSRYRSFQDDLVDDKTWAEKDVLLPRLVAITAPISTQLGRAERNAQYPL